MPLQRMIRFLSLSFGVLFSISSLAQGNDVSFRTPARRYGTAYSIKMTLKKKGFEYVIPVWVKPDQKVSSLDRSLILEMGWTYPELKAEEVSLSGEKLEYAQFQNQKSDWVGRPEFPKPCCAGIIGQDILKDFEVKFDPRPPAHLEWTRIIVSEAPSPKKDRVFFESLKDMFSLKKEIVKLQGKSVDLSHVPLLLNFSQAKLETLKN